MPIEIHFHNVNNNYLILSVINPSQFLTMWGWYIVNN